MVMKAARGFTMWPNKTTGVNAGGPYQLAMQKCSL